MAASVSSSASCSGESCFSLFLPTALVLPPLCPPGSRRHHHRVHPASHDGRDVIGHTARGRTAPGERVLAHGIAHRRGDRPVERRHIGVHLEDAHYPSPHVPVHTSFPQMHLSFFIQT